MILLPLAACGGLAATPSDTGATTEVDAGAHPNPVAGADADTDADPGVGLHPVLAAPKASLLPTVNIAPAVGWPAGATPRAAAGLRVQAFASGLDHPRWLCVLPNGDVLVAETNAPPKPDDARGLKGWVMGQVMTRAGAAVPSANRITLLRDGTGRGVADTRTAFLEGLNSPFGMALVGDALFVATTDAVLRFPYVSGQTRITAAATKLVDLPAGPINHHWTKNLIASADGRTLFVTVGSNSNVGERGLDAEAGRAAIWSVDVRTGEHHEMATGMRNPNGLAWEPRSGRLWTVVNERDELGDNLVPDYLTSVTEGAFYGWPWSWYGSHMDVRVHPRAPERMAQAIVPDYALGSHVAALGLASVRGKPPLPSLAEGMFVGEHGSWNRRPASGYQVVFVPFAEGRPTGALPQVVLGGFLAANGSAYGRPVGVALEAGGALLVADDVGNTIWRVSAVP
jgi:glucose/arabinose dehydrogenase